MKEFKEKWAASQCDLHDALKACNEKEEERQNALKLLQSALEKLKEEQKLCTNYKEMLEKKKTTNKDDTKKVKENIILKFPFNPSSFSISQFFSKINQLLQN